MRNADGSFEVDGRLTLDVAARDLGIAFPPVAARGRDAGRLRHHPAPRAPRSPATSSTAVGYRFTVLEVRDRRIRRLRAVRLPSVEPTSEG